MLSRSGREDPPSTKSKSTLDTKTEVNRLASNPQKRTTANPFTGPVPKIKRNNTETTVVTWVSMIVTKAFEKPVLTAETTFLPLHNSSRMRSKIRTFESTAIPINNTTPAIPGDRKSTRLNSSHE